MLNRSSSEQELKQSIVHPLIIDERESESSLQTTEEQEAHFKFNVNANETYRRIANEMERFQTKTMKVIFTGKATKQHIPVINLLLNFDNLKELDLSWCNITNEFVPIIITLIKECPLLTHVKLTNNLITNGAIKLLISELATSKLFKLDLTGNQIDPDYLVKIQNLLATTNSAVWLPKHKGYIFISSPNGYIETSSPDPFWPWMRQKFNIIKNFQSFDKNNPHCFNDNGLEPLNVRFGYEAAYLHSKGLTVDGYFALLAASYLGDENSLKVLLGKVPLGNKRIDPKQLDLLCNPAMVAKIYKLLHEKAETWTKVYKQLFGQNQAYAGMITLSIERGSYLKLIPWLIAEGYITRVSIEKFNSILKDVNPALPLLPMYTEEDIKKEIDTTVDPSSPATPELPKLQPSIENSLMITEQELESAQQLIEDREQEIQKLKDLLNQQQQTQATQELTLADQEERLRKLEEEQAIYRQTFKEKKERYNAQSEFKQNENCLYYYKQLAIYVENCFLGAKAVMKYAKVSPTPLVGSTSMAATETAAMIDCAHVIGVGAFETCLSIVPPIAKVIEIVTRIAQHAHDKSYVKSLESLAKLTNFKDSQKLAEYIARLLTYQHMDQLKNRIKIADQASREKFLDHLIAFATLRMFEAMRQRKINFNDISYQEIAKQMTNQITQKFSSTEKFMHEIDAYLKNYKTDDGKYTPVDFYFQSNVNVVANPPVIREQDDKKTNLVNSETMITKTTFKRIKDELDKKIALLEEKNANQQEQINSLQKQNEEQKAINAELLKKFEQLEKMLAQNTNFNRQASVSKQGQFGSSFSQSKIPAPSTRPKGP